MPIGHSDEGIFLNWDSIFLDDCTLCQVKKKVSAHFSLYRHNVYVLTQVMLWLKILLQLNSCHIFCLPRICSWVKLEIIFYNKVEMGGFKKLLSSPFPSPPLSSPPLPSYFFPSSFIFIWGWTFWIACHEILPFLLTVSEEFWLVSPLCYSLITVGNRGVSDVFILPS